MTKVERRLIADYEALVGDLLAGLRPDNHGRAVDLARLPDRIRGYGHVKQAAIDRAEAEKTELLAAFRAPPGSRAEAAE